MVEASGTSERETSFDVDKTAWNETSYEIAPHSTVSYTVRHVCVCIFNWETFLISLLSVDGPLDLKASKMFSVASQTRRRHSSLTDGNFDMRKGNEPLTSRKNF